jgi:hypothetical protein
MTIRITDLKPDTTTTYLGIRTPTLVKTRLENLAYDRRTTVTSLVNKAIENLLAAQQPALASPDEGYPDRTGFPVTLGCTVSLAMVETTGPVHAKVVALLPDAAGLPSAEIERDNGLVQLLGTRYLRVVI